MSTIRRLMRANVEGAVRVALGFAVIYAVVAAAIILVRSPAQVRVLAVVIPAYFIAAIAAGAVAGLLGTFISGTLGAVLIGMVAAVPVAIALLTVVLGLPTSWDRTGWTTVAIFSVLMGGLAGPIVRTQFAGRH